MISQQWTWKELIVHSFRKEKESHWENGTEKNYLKVKGREANYSTLLLPLKNIFYSISFCAAAWEGKKSILPIFHSMKIMNLLPIYTLLWWEWMNESIQRSPSKSVFDTFPSIFYFSSYILSLHWSMKKEEINSIYKSKRGEFPRRKFSISIFSLPLSLSK